MCKLSMLLSSLLLVSAPLPAFGAAPEHVPNTLSRAGAERPFFVSATALTDGSGNVRWEALSPHLKAAIQSTAERQRRERLQVSATSAGSPDIQPCDEMTLTFPHVSEPARTWQDLSEHAHSIVRGRVIGLTPGFEMTSPVTMISVSIESVVRTDPAFPRAGIVYVSYPQADFRVGTTRFCSAGPNASFAPALGDDVLVFASDPPADETHSYLLTQPEHLIFFQHGKAVLPARLAGDVADLRHKSLQELEELLRAAHPAIPMDRRQR